MVYALRSCLLAVGVAVVGALGCKSELKLKPGDELYGILDEAVLEVSMRGSGRRADARRFRPEQPLRFSFEDEGPGGLEHCGPSPELSAAVAQALQIHVRSVLDDAKSKAFIAAHPADTWSQLEIRSIMSDVDPFRLNLISDGKSGVLYARLPADPQVFTIDASKLRLLSLHCPAARPDEQAPPSAP